MDPALFEAVTDSITVFAITLGVELAFTALYVLSSISQLLNSARISVVNRFGLVNQVCGISSALFGLLPFLLSYLPCKILIGSCLGFQLRRFVVFYFMMYRLNVIKPFTNIQIYVVHLLFILHIASSFVHCLTFDTINPGGVLCIPIHLDWTRWPTRGLNAALDILSLWGIFDRYQYVKKKTANINNSEARSYVGELRFGIFPLLMLQITSYVLQFVFDNTPIYLFLIYGFEIFISIMMYMSFTYQTKARQASSGGVHSPGTGKHSTMASATMASDIDLSSSATQV
ncbi:hypothetical protein HK102_014108 [Quaeritorhiza haematococci]|nr:hypothetical protein HK102_014108 [Quaeritorhiza haematococci]